jgi:predicted dehydrogenase
MKNKSTPDVAPARDLVPVAVVGVGRMGLHHARVYSELQGCTLVAVCDSDLACARKAADQFQCAAFDSVESMLAAGLAIRAASVVVPTASHRSVAEVLLRAGVDLLIEKPLAFSLPDAQAIVQQAKARGAILQVGHTERFNPALLALGSYELKAKYIDVQRISPMTFRSIDIGVVLDLMIHDLDIVQHLVSAPVTDVAAVGVSVVGAHEDIANARLTFANGCVANLTASRLALKTERKMRLFSPDAYVSVDYHRKSGVVIRRTANEDELKRVRKKVEAGDFADLRELNYPELVKYEELTVVDREPLRSEMESFLEAVRLRRKPIVTGEDGCIAVDLAGRICTAISEHRWEGAEMRLN